MINKNLTNTIRRVLKEETTLLTEGCKCATIGGTLMTTGCDYGAGERCSCSTELCIPNPIRGNEMVVTPEGGGSNDNKWKANTDYESYEDSDLELTRDIKRRLNESQLLNEIESCEDQGLNPCGEGPNAGGCEGGFCECYSQNGFNTHMGVLSCEKGCNCGGKIKHDDDLELSADIKRRLDEVAVSKSQKRFWQFVKSCKTSKYKNCGTGTDIKDAAKTTSMKEINKYVKTPDKGLPEKTSNTEQELEEKYWWLNRWYLPMKKYRGYY